MITDILFSLFAILLTSRLIDQFLREKAVMRWRVSTYAARHAIGEMSCSDLISSSTAWLHALLDLVRGGKLLSRRGLKNTFILSVCFLTVSAYPLGAIGLFPTSSPLESHASFAVTTLYFTMLSTATLFISIHQTALFTKISKNKRFIAILSLFSVGILLKIFIFTSFLTISFFIPAMFLIELELFDFFSLFSGMYEKIELAIASMFTDSVYYDRLGYPVSGFDHLLSIMLRPFLLATLLPSFLWLCFLSSSLLVWGLPRLYRPFGALFSKLSKSRYPATTLAVFAVLPPTLILVVLNQL